MVGFADAFRSELVGLNVEVTRHCRSSRLIKTLDVAGR
jgi:hypothetical protein